MMPGSIVNLTKTITTKNEGVLATYRLNKACSIPVLVLGRPADVELPEVKAAMLAIRGIRPVIVSKGS